MHDGARRFVRLVIALVVTTAVGVAATASDSPARTAEPAIVRLVATGGTIANRSGGRLSADDLLASVPGLRDHARVEAEQFSNVASGSLTLGQWLDLARRLNLLFSTRADLAGLVVTVGTDTLEELAYFLHLTVRDPRPVVLVGAMRTPETPGYDGAANLLAAFRVAADPAARGRGALVVLNDEIHGAREVTKTDTMRLQSFASPGAGPLGVVDRDRVVFARASDRRHTARSEFDVTSHATLPRVDVLLVYQDAPGDLITAAVDAGARGVVVAAAGAGSTSGTQEAGLRGALERGVVVVRASRVGAGRVPPRPGGPAGPGASAWERRITADDLPPVKARVLLMLALLQTDRPEVIQRMFLEY